MAAIVQTRNSPLTRVRPFFGQLLDRDPTAHDWLTRLLEVAPLRERVPGPILRAPGTLDPVLVGCRGYKDRVLRARVWLRECFEYSIAPPEKLLRWAIQNPGELDPPMKGGSPDLGKSEEAQKWRRAALRRPSRS